MSQFETQEIIPNQRVLALGDITSYSGILAVQMFPWGEIEPIDSFNQIGTELQKDHNAVAVMPVHNTLDHAVGPVTAMLYEKQVRAIQAGVLAVHPHIMGVGELDDLEEVYSNAKLLGQIRDFTQHYDLRTHSMTSTSDAAKLVKEAADPRLAAGGTLAAAQQYDLPILAKNVHDKVGAGINETTFLVVKARNGDDIDPAEFAGIEQVHSTFVVQVNNSGEAGALQRINGPLNEIGFNMIDIHSTNVRGYRDRYMFLIRAMHHGDALAELAKYDLEHDEVEFDNLGSHYPPGETYDSDIDYGTLIA